MTWALNANGFLGDEEKIKELFGKVKALFSDAETGVTNSQFTGTGVWENDFHKTADAAQGPASDPAPPPAEVAVEAPTTDQGETPLSPEPVSEGASGPGE